MNTLSKALPKVIRLLLLRSETWS